MSVLTADKDVVRGEDTLIEVPVTDDEIIYKGALVCVDADGYALAAADTAAYKFLGIAYDQQDNTGTGHADGAKKVRVYRRGIFKLVCTDITQNMVGQLMYVRDDQTVDNNQITNWVCVGRLVKYVSATSGWVDIGDRHVTPTVSYRDAVELAFGDDQDIVMVWENDIFSIIPAADDAVVVWGIINFTVHQRMAIDGQIQFRDANAYIYSTAAGRIAIIASTKIYLTSSGTGTDDIVLGGTVSVSDNITMATNKRVNFWDATAYIYSTAAGRIAIVAATRIYLTSSGTGADDIAIAGTVSVSDNITLATNKMFYFRDTATYIYSYSANNLGIISAGNINLTAAGNIILNGTVSAADNITVATDKKLYFRDTSAYIYSTVAGKLAIVASTQIYLTADVVTVSGNIQMATDKKLYFRDTAAYIYSTQADRLALIASHTVYLTTARVVMSAGCIMPAMPTGDPSVAGQLWNNSNVVNISAG